MKIWKLLIRFGRHLAPTIAKYRWSFTLSGLGFWSGLLITDAIIPLQYKAIVDYMTTHDLERVLSVELWWLIAVLVGFYILYTILFRISDWGMWHSQSQIMKDLSDRSLERTMDHSYRFFADNFAGGLSAKIKRLTRSFEVMHDIAIYNIGMSILVITASTILFFMQSFIIGVFFLIWLMIYLAAMAFYLNYRHSYDLKRSEADSLVMAAVSDIITNILSVKIFSRRRQELTDFQKVTDSELRDRLASDKILFIQVAIQSTLFVFMEMAILVIMIRLWADGLMTVGSFFLIQTLFFGVFHALFGLANSISRFTEALADAGEMLNIIEQPLEVADPAKPEKSKIKKGEIEFDNINFHYHPENQVFTDFSLTIPAGQRVGLVGASGCGKSTLTKLILRFIDVQSGDITIDGQSIKAITQDDLRAAIAYVPQEPALFHRSLAENIAYGNDKATKAQIIAAAKRAHAHEFISQLPQGYDTLVGERGVKLSGGERQRVAIARAILKDAPIIILDEATSSLDTESERFIKDAFDGLIAGRTTIVIAHRLSTIKKMDRIIVMENGKIIEDGTHDELLSKEEIYHRFWQYQISE